MRYQGHTNYSGYEAHRNTSPQLVKFLSFGQHGVYQWLREAKRKTKQQTALLKARKIEKVIDRSLGKGSAPRDPTLPRDDAKAHRESIEKISS